jgi:hypothetical protein
MKGLKALEVINHTVRTTFHSFRSVCALGIVSLFGFFLAASAPHRVHHLFEKPSFPAANNHAHDHHTADTDHSHSGNHESRQPQQGDCAMQTAAQNTHLSSPQLVEVAFLQISLPRNPDRRVIATRSFNPSPFSQRAPPTI